MDASRWIGSLARRAKARRKHGAREPFGRNTASYHLLSSRPMLGGIDKEEGIMSATLAGTGVSIVFVHGGFLPEKVPAGSRHREFAQHIEANSASGAGGMRRKIRGDADSGTRRSRRAHAPIAAGSRDYGQNRAARQTQIIGPDSATRSRPATADGSCELKLLKNRIPTTTDTRRALQDAVRIGRRIISGEAGLTVSRDASQEVRNPKQSAKLAFRRTNERTSHDGE